MRATRSGWLASTGRVSTIDGRETAPQSMPGTAFTDPVKKEPYPLPELITSGKSVGVPGTLLGVVGSFVIQRLAGWPTALSPGGQHTRNETRQAIHKERNRCPASKSKKSPSSAPA